MEKFTAEVETLNTEVRDKKAVLARENEEAAAAKAEVGQLEAALAASMESIEPLKQELTSCEEGIRRTRRDIEHYTAKKEEYRQRGAGHQQDRRTKEAEGATLLERATKWSEERIETRKNVEVLKKEVLKLQGNLQKLTESTEPRELVKANFTKYRQLYNQAVQDLKDLARLITALNKAIDRRKKGYKMILRATSQNVQRNFTAQLNIRNFVGMLKFNHADKTLAVKVNPNEGSTAGGMNIDRDLKSLSGGERSFTLVSFILSLWNVMNPPFRYKTQCLTLVYLRFKALIFYFCYMYTLIIYLKGV